MAKDTKSYSGGAGGPAFVGSMIAGFGIGLAYNNPGVGFIIGFGVGFILMAFINRKS